MDKNCFKEKIKLILLAALLGLLFICIFNFVVLDVLYRFSYLTITQMMLIFIIISFCEEIALIIFVNIALSGKTYIENFDKLIKNLPRVITLYIILVIFFVSIKKELIWNYDELKDIINIQWTIFGISIAVFLFWHVFVSKHWETTKDLESADNNDNKLINKKKHYEKREDYSIDLSTCLISGVLLSINLVVILIATLGVYFIWRENTIVLQTLIIFSFYMCTNTICSLLQDVILPLFNQKKILYNKNKLSIYEKKEYALLQMLSDKEIECLEDILKSCNCDEEGRKKFILKAYEVVKNLKQEKVRNIDSKANQNDKDIGKKK